MEKVGKTKFNGELKKSILGAVNKIGGFKKFINSGETVFLKPNFNTADPSPASSDVKFIQAVAELIYECGAKFVCVGDSSMFRLNTRKVFEKAGLFELEKSKDYPVRVYPLEEKEWVKKEIPKGKYLKTVTLPKILDEVDKVIFLPCMKTHFMANFTGALKLSVGLMKPSERIHLHLGNLQEKIAELNTIINPDLIIMDGRKCFITGGPERGDVREPNIILTSCDRIAIDIEEVKTIQSFSGNSLEGINPLELPQIKKALEFGIGKA